MLWRRKPGQARPAPTPGDLYPNIAVRATATFVDLLLCLWLAAAVGEATAALLPAAGAERLVFPGFVFAYASGFVASRWQATPGKLICGLRVVGSDGGRLSLARAALRSAVVMLVLYLALNVDAWTWNSQLRPIGAIGMVLILLAAVTPRRQAGHDLLLRTLVVRRQAMMHPDGPGRLGDADFVCTRGGRGIVQQIGNFVLFAAGAGAWLIVVDQSHERDRRARIGYALSEARQLAPLLEAFHRQHGRFPASAAELGVPAQRNYPAGGSNTLEADGRILIRFAVLPDLAAGAIVLRPAIQDDGIVWQCSSDNPQIVPRLPHSCRDAAR